MIIPDIWLSLAIGILLSLLFTEVTGMLPAGLIVPGYLALQFKQPLSLLVIFLISFLTYFIVVFGIGKITILYGKRKFAAMIIVAILLTIIAHFVYPMNSIQVLGLSGIGVVVPGIIANTIQRQGFSATVLSTILLAGITFSSLFLYNILL